jgi:hypothetical protein
LIKTGSFLFVYLLITFTVVPFLAKKTGRVPLSIRSSANLRPLNLLTCLLNRHYTTPSLARLIEINAAKMNSHFPGTTVCYLDAGFPFINGFPLIPHLSHNDGRKLDIALFYKNAVTKQPVNGAPSIIGYGIGEEPLAGEINTAADCASRNKWQYSFMNKIVPQGSKSKYSFDMDRTRYMMILLAEDYGTEKIFIEPHLKTRMRLSAYDKIRFHGCNAVRHDDHIHIQAY